MNISVLTSLYNSEKYLESFFRNFLKMSNLFDLELIVIHNDPSEMENKIIANYRNQIPHIIYIKTKREGVYRSWNRGIEASNGKYIAMWNVDDIRFTNSLQEQAKYLDDHSDISIVSGNYYKVFTYGEEKGILKKDPVRFNRFNGVFKFNNGCFLMWRKIVHNKIGYFDEQFKVGGDWEFWCRVTINYRAANPGTNLGCYLRDSQDGISKVVKEFREIENFIVKSRYYKLYIINYFKIKSNSSFLLKSIKNFDVYTDIDINTPKINISFFLSVILFWWPSLLNHLIDLKYLLFKYTAKKIKNSQ